MLYLNYILTIVVALAIDRSYSVLADNARFQALKPSTISSLPDDRRSINFKERTEETPNKREHSENESDKTQDSRQDKKIRTLPGPLIAENGDKSLNHLCCGSRYEVQGSPTRGESSQGSGHKGSSDNARYPSRYGSRPEDRFGWQSYTPTTGRRGTMGSSVGSGTSGSGGLYDSQAGGDRYGGSRPSYYGGDNEYDRPSNSGNRPGRPSYGYGGNGYGDSGAFGSNGYEISRPSSYGGSRHPGGINFGGGRPGGGSYGIGNYGGGAGHGVYGTIGEEDEFPGQEDGADGGGPPHPGVNNIQTQKAVALKALAGVALIGAAAALATNPVLLPLGVLAGRKKRSVHSSSQLPHIDVDKLIKLLEDNFSKMYRKKITKQVLDSPTCVAMLACQVHQGDILEPKNNSNDNANRDNIYNSLRMRLVNLIQRKLLYSDVDYKNLSKLIKSNEAYNGNCNVFLCDFIKI